MSPSPLPSSISTSYGAPWKAWLLLTLGMAMVGGNISVGKLLLEEFPLWFLSLLRFAIGTAVLLPLVMTTEGLRYKLTGKQYVELFLQALTGVFLFNLFTLYGVRYTAAVDAGIITATIPAAVALLSVLWLREHINGIGWLAVALAVGGVALVNLQGESSSAAENRLLGNSFMLAAVIVQAIFAILAKRLSGTLSPMKMALGVNLASLVMFLPPGLMEAAETDISAISPMAWGIMLYWALTASVISYMLWYAGVARAPANVVGLFTGVMPLAAMAVAIGVLGEPLTIFHLLGLLVVLLALWLGTRQHK